MIQFHKLPACDRYYRQPSLINAVGFIPAFLSADDPRPADKQFDQNYVGGWTQFDGFMTSPGPEVEGNWCLLNLRYPGDPTLPPLAYALLRDEMIVVYPSAWVMILQQDGSYQISRMD